MTMLESLLKSCQLVERCLASLRMFDKIPSLDDWAAIEDLVKFLKAFKKARVAERLRLPNVQHNPAL